MSVDEIIKQVEDDLVLCEGEGGWVEMGGPGSGHWRHGGRKGKRGGSIPSRKAMGPPKSGKPLGGHGGTGTRYGYSSDGEKFVENSVIKQDVFWGTPHPESVLSEGIWASSDEVNWYSGISLGKTAEESRGYHLGPEGEGDIFRTKVFTSNPVKFGSGKVVGWDGIDIGSFYELAHSQGFDAITGPGEIRVFDPNQVMILGHGMRKWRPYSEV